MASRFVIVGLLSTAAHALLFLALRAPLGPEWANAVALTLTAVANTAANRRLTFGVRGREQVLRDHAVGLAVFLLGLCVTTGALALFPPALIVVVAANALVTLLRFVALRTVFAGRGLASTA